MSCQPQFVCPNKFCPKPLLHAVLFTSFSWPILAHPILAHNVEVSGDVAATFHIEPHHNPRAGQPAQAWFALTRKGGALIPLQQCNCKLTVYPEPHSSATKPTLQPALKPVDVEQYKGIPGATIVFPKAGIYDLRLKGTPKKPGDFRPFELNYNVTVGG